MSLASCTAAGRASGARGPSVASSSVTSTMGLALSGLMRAAFLRTRLCSPRASQHCRAWLSSLRACKQAAMSCGAGEQRSASRPGQEAVCQHMELP
eukprot:4215752-Lingulodinium_polyedra.AAC.1